MRNKIQIKSKDKIPTTNEIHIDDRTIFFNEVNIACKNFGFEEVKFEIDQNYGCPENVYRVKRPENPNIKENCENFDKLVNYMAEFSRKHDIAYILQTSFFPIA